jgi:predicted Zn-dependent peptidase
MTNVLKLDNGITVVLDEIPFVRSIAFGVWVKNGARNEDKSVNGISHFIEHMLFKGTDKRTAKMIAEEMDAVGGQINAYTTKEFTCYYTRTLDSHFDTALDIISDMFLNSVFAEADIVKERGVIIEEINMYEDSREDLGQDRLEWGVFEGASLGFPVLGDKGSVSSFGHDTFTEYFGRNYHTENTVIAVAGNFISAEMSEKINAAFGGFKRKAAFVPPVFGARFNKYQAAKEKDIEQVHICLGFPGINLSAEDDMYAISALNTVFGGGMSSRLFQTVREEHGLSYAIYSHNVSYSDCGVFSVYAALVKEQVAAVLELIIKEINRLETDRITPAQLAKTKEQLKSNYVLSLENSLSRMSGLGRSQLLLNKILSPAETIDKIDAVTMDDIYRLKDMVFDMKQMSICAIGDVAGLDLNVSL